MTTQRSRTEILHRTKPERARKLRRKLTEWPLLSTHGLVILSILLDKDIKVAEVAERVGITERAAISIIADLETAGYLSSVREGRRNHYIVHLDRNLRHPLKKGKKLGELFCKFIPAERGKR